MAPAVKLAHEQLHNGTGTGSDYLGWINLPFDYDKEEFARIQKAAAKIQSDSDVLVVIGIGGSYLGARAAIEMLSHSFYNMLPKDQRKTPQIFFAGNNISSTYVTHLLQAARRQGLVDQRHLQIGHDDRTGDRFPYFPRSAGEQVRQRSSAQTDLRDDGQSARRA